MYSFPLETHGVIIETVQFFFLLLLFACLYFLQMMYEKLVEKLCSFLLNIWSNSWKKVDTVPHILGFK